MRIGIVGCAGRMGRMLVLTVLETPGAELAGGLETPGHPLLGHDVGTSAGGRSCGLSITDDATQLFASADTVIDFSTPGALIEHAALAGTHGTAMVVGTTGLTGEHTAALRQAAAKVAVVHAPNMSVGVNLLLGLTRQLATILGNDYDIEIVEMHHRHKVDAPSGTALALGEAAAAGRGVTLGDVAVLSREGHTGARPPGAIGFATLRGGDVVGEHTVMFAAEGESIALTHKATSRAVFAKGAVRAALWTKDRPPRLYGMHDVLGLG